uniref:Uncharacterized protein MANES_05G104200 n=2 Tax=Rhizophora mucronata TaxID=61149 RepID=A0A2P2KMT7_RHIMU
MGMSSTNTEERKEPEQGAEGGDTVSLDRSQNDNNPTVEMEAELHKIEDPCCENSLSSIQQPEENMKEKYGGLSKKKPLISKDHERAFFDSADWALGKFKQGAQKPKGALEVLRPKLEVTPHHQVRSRLSADDASTTKCEGSRDTTHHTSSETEECMSDVGKDEVIASGDHTSVG